MYQPQWRKIDTLPRSMRLLGVSGRKMPPRVRMIAGTPARARETRHPQPCNWHSQPNQGNSHGWKSGKEETAFSNTRERFAVFLHALAWIRLQNLYCPSKSSADFCIGGTWIDPLLQILASLTWHKVWCSIILRSIWIASSDKRKVDNGCGSKKLTFMCWVPKLMAWAKTIPRLSTTCNASICHDSAASSEHLQLILYPLYYCISGGKAPWIPLLLIRACLCTNSTRSKTLVGRIAGQRDQHADAAFNLSQIRMI